MTSIPKVPRLRGLLLAICSAALCSCVTQSVPSHGGGKRFFFEQALIAEAVDEAIDGLDLGSIPVANPIDLFVIAMGDEGGGSDGPGGALSFIGLGSSRGGSSASGYAASAPVGGGGTSHAFANARDIEFVRGKVLQAVASKGIPISNAKTDAAQVGGSLYVLVSELGTAKEGFNLLVYREVKLAARAAMEAFYIPKAEVAGAPQDYVPLGSGACTTEYSAEYIFGNGPIHGAKIKVTPGAIPARIERAETLSPMTEESGS